MREQEFRVSQREGSTAGVHGRGPWQGVTHEKLVKVSFRCTSSREAWG